MKLCKDCRHRKRTTLGWKCRAGAYIPKKKVLSPIDGKTTLEDPGQFEGLPRCDYMRREEHSFIVRQCGSEGELWEHRTPWWKMQWVRFDE